MYETVILRYLVNVSIRLQINMMQLVRILFFSYKAI